MPSFHRTRSNSVDRGLNRPSRLQVTGFDVHDPDEDSPLVTPSPEERIQEANARKSRSLNLDLAPGWDKFAEEFRQAHQAKQSPPPATSPSWDRSQHLSNLMEDGDAYGDDGDGYGIGDYPMETGSPVMAINLGRMGSKRKSPVRGGRSLKYQVDIEQPSSPLPGSPTPRVKGSELGYVQRANPRRSRSLDSADPNSLLRSPEWAHYKEDNEEFDSLTHDQDLLSRWAKKMHRLRGIFKLIGELVGFASAILTVLLMVRIVVFVEEEKHKWNVAYDNAGSVLKHDCTESLSAYRVYYLIGITFAVLLAMLSALVVIALFRNLWVYPDKCRAVRVLVDELGFHENVEETIYKLCSSLKWFAKGILLLVLFMGAYESENDSFLHSNCDEQNDVAGRLAWWFGSGLMLRSISMGWDMVFSWLPFLCIRWYCPLLYASELHSETSESVLGRSAL